MSETPEQPATPPEPHLGAVIEAAQQYGDDRVAHATVEAMRQLDEANLKVATLSDDLATRTGERDLAQRAVLDLNEIVTTKDSELGVKTGELAVATTTIAALRARIAVLEGGMPPDPPSTAVPVMGMSTEDNKWTERVALTGPVNSRRLFESGWDPAGIVAKAKQAKAGGLTPVISMKVPPAEWAAAATGSWDARFRDFGKTLAALDFRAYGTLNHEPRGGAIDTPAELVPWSKMLTRAFTIIRAELAPTSKVMVGPIDNGHPFGIKWGHLTDAELAVYYTPALLAASQFLAGDFYDGATNTNSGEPAWVKMVEFEKWTKRIGFVGPLGVGEWNFITGKDCRDMWAKIDKPRWAFIELFNNSANNRTDLPTSINGSWVLVPGTDRAAAYREVLDLAIPGRS